MLILPLIALAVSMGIAGCERKGSPASIPPAVRADAGTVSPLAIILAPHAGERRIDAEIRRAQLRAKDAVKPEITIEHLGWLFVSKARESFDPGYYKLAEQCALHLESLQAGSPEALLLRGHALHSQHRFAEAESLARKLVEQRGLGFDFGLLGDILVDQGRVTEATSAYQQMLDLKPDPQGYARSAHIRWLRDDLEGAVELMRMAAQGAAPRGSESAAWMHTQLARYLWQHQLPREAESSLEIALEMQKDYPPALLLRGRLLLSDGRMEEALACLREAAKNNPLPEYRWVLGEALRAVNLDEEAQEVERQLHRRSTSSDPRTYSLYLATRGEQIDKSVELARTELKERQDIFTHDALAWALAASGDLDGARSEMALALAEGTADARLFLHAAVIATKAGAMDEAGNWMGKLTPLLSQLLPSEKEHLGIMSNQISESAASRPNPVATAVSTPFPAGPLGALAKEN